jgi:hypothetical protein
MNNAAVVHVVGPRSDPQARDSLGRTQILNVTVVGERNYGSEYRHVALPSVTRLRDAFEEYFYGHLVYKPTPTAREHTDKCGVPHPPTVTDACHRARNAILIADSGNRCLLPMRTGGRQRIRASKANSECPTPSDLGR